MVLPQALRIVIPALLNDIIRAFKNTTFVSIIGLFDVREKEIRHLFRWSRVRNRSCHRPFWQRPRPTRHLRRHGRGPR